MNILKKLDEMLGEETVTADVDVTPTKGSTMMARRQAYDHFRYGNKKFKNFGDALTHVRENYVKGQMLHGVRKNGKSFEKEEVRVKY